MLSLPGNGGTALHLGKGLEQMCVVSVGTGAEWEGSFGDADVSRDWEGKCVFVHYAVLA